MEAEDGSISEPSSAGPTGQAQVSAEQVAIAKAGPLPAVIADVGVHF